MDESKIFGVSLRGWIALFITVTICAMAVLMLEVKEPLYSISLFVIGFYFGQKSIKNGGEKNGNGIS